MVVREDWEVGGPQSLKLPRRRNPATTQASFPPMKKPSLTFIPYDYVLTDSTEQNNLVYGVKNRNLDVYKMTSQKCTHQCTEILIRDLEHQILMTIVTK